MHLKFRLGDIECLVALYRLVLDPRTGQRENELQQGEGRGAFREDATDEFTVDIVDVYLSNISIISQWLEQLPICSCMLLCS